ncbi:MAG: phosphatase PAP2 family protein [Candidatus Taylorbacteria bacterium]|nr:phosphatase PAP2 family protein [Candidatus Taylorbacteria bacterium]
MMIGTVSDTLGILDEWLFRFLSEYHTPFGIKCMVYVSDFFDPVHLAMYTVALVLLLWLQKKDTHLLQFSFAMLSGAFSIFVLKYGFKLPRPEHALITESGYTFASGHAGISVIFFLLIAHAYKSHIQNRFLRYLFVSLCVGLIILVGLSRVYLGVHYFTDVIAGFAVGAIIFAISVLFFK